MMTPHVIVVFMIGFALGGVFVDFVHMAFQ